MTERAYLDWNATAPLRPEAREAMVAALGRTGNASSVHGEGRAARALIEKARAEVAALVGAEPASVVFTSGATEANMLALTPSLGDDALLVSAIEHPSVRGGWPVSTAVDRDSGDRRGCCRPRRARGADRAGQAAAGLGDAGQQRDRNRSAGRASSPTSSMRAGGLLHVDAVQAPGRMPSISSALGADMLTLSRTSSAARRGRRADRARRDLRSSR